MKRGWRRTQQVPSVAFDVEEDGESAEGLVAGFGDERDPMFDHSLVRGGEVVDAEKESDAPGELLASGPSLIWTVRLCQQQAGFAIRRAHDDPTLWPSIVGE